MIQALQRAHAAWARKAGALPARKVIWGLAAVFCVWVLLDVLALQLTGGVARSTFDAMVRARVLVDKPDPRVLIIDIDEPSLKRMAPEFGRWPWPRDTLATVLDYLEQQQPAAIVWDIVFSDADRISPGGDAAFDSAVQRSRHSHFSVARLSHDTDAQSEISRAALPTLWASAAPSAAAKQSATVAVIPPALSAVAASRLGYNNGYVDADGVLRRYRSFETLADGSSIQSIPMSVLAALRPDAYQQALAAMPAAGDTGGALIAWRRAPSAYPRVSFADVFEAAEGGKPTAAVPSFAGKILIIGSAAASLHDIHPTPLGATHPGVDALATVLDNTVNQRHIRELPRWLNALLAVALCLGLAAWVQHRKIASLTVPTLVLPAGLMFVSYLTLNGAPVFVDLQLSAALALVFLALLRYWNQLRRKYWCTPPEGAGLALWELRRSSPWLEVPLDHLIDLVEKHAPDCRVVVPDLFVGAFQELRWPELGCNAALVGPHDTLQRKLPDLARAVQRVATGQGSLLSLEGTHNRQTIAHAALRVWSAHDTTDSGGEPT